MLTEAIKSYLQRTNTTAIQPKAVLFDMDGVLYDSMKNHAGAWYKTIADLGIPCCSEEFYMYEGRTGASTINLLFERTYNRPATEEEKQYIYAQKSANFASMPEVAPMAGAAELLQQVKELGLTPVLVTGSGQPSLLDRLNHAFPDIFLPELMVTAFDVKYGKPHPEPYLMGLEKAGIAPHEAIVVENAPLGVESGVAAGIFTIAANTGPLADSVLLDAGADILYHSIEELRQQFATIYQTLLTTTL